MHERDCLAGCIANYDCGGLDLPGPAGQQAESFAPWCWISFGVEGKKIRVGNESYEGDRNTACIKSMEIGWTDMPSMKCEIVDERGGTLGAVADAVRKCIKSGNLTNVGKGTLCNFQFGWIITTCRGGARESHVVPSPTFTLMIQKLDVIYSEGKIKYSIEAVTLNSAYENSRVDSTTGTDDKPVKIEDAIAKLCSQDPPCVVRYVELTSDGRLKDVQFEWASGSGTVRGAWQGDNQNRLSTITKWLSGFRVKDGKCDKGLIIYWSPDKHDELVIMKDPLPGPNESRSCSGGTEEAKWGPLGTFIVNGGKCSTVIEFNPSMDIISAVSSFAAGGGTSGPNKTASQLAEDKRCGNQNGQGTEAGTQLQATITQQAVENYGTKNANDQALKSEIAHHRASVVTSVQSPGVTAQLKILGNPSPRFCNFGASRNLSIVVINPYHLRGSGSCGDWLAYPVCNELFSNKLWMCRSINHSISTGSYTTTIEAHLVAPGVQISSDDPLGGPGSGGSIMTNTC